MKRQKKAHTWKVGKCLFQVSLRTETGRKSRNPANGLPESAGLWKEHVCFWSARSERGRTARSFPHPVAFSRDVWNGRPSPKVRPKNGWFVLKPGVSGTPRSFFPGGKKISLIGPFLARSLRSVCLLWPVATGNVFSGTKKRTRWQEADSGRPIKTMRRQVKQFCTSCKQRGGC